MTIPTHDADTHSGGNRDPDREAPRGLLSVASSFARRAFMDLRRVAPRLENRDRHLDAAVRWLKRAQRMTPDDGVSYGYSARGGWRDSYRETSGYIVVTLFDLARAGDAEARELAERVARWLCEVQEPDGSFANPRYHAGRGIVFDTGQVLLGLARAYRETDDESFLHASRQAAAWLVTQMDDDGVWRKSTHLGHPHTYNTRVAWSLLEAAQLDGDSDLERAARRNLDWALSRETAGWFQDCAFRPGVPPFTHTIAYAIRGFLESARLLGEKAYADVAKRAGDAVLSHVRDDGWIPGQIDEQGRPRARYCCLTGNCQLAIIWLRLHRLTGESKYLDAARRSLGYVMGCQDLDTRDESVHGAIPGSRPIWGRYAPLSYPNWATKFFIDAMLLWNEIEP